jgi:hypothetical protein
MKGWFLKNLGDATLAYQSLERIEKMLLSEYASAGSPHDMAAFMRHESEGCLHCQLTVYLSPNLVDVAVEIDAEPCGKPSPVGLSLLLGSQDSFKTLFPDSGS